MCEHTVLSDGCRQTGRIRTPQLRIPPIRSVRARRWWNGVSGCC